MVQEKLKILNVLTVVVLTPLISEAIQKLLLKLQQPISSDNDFPEITNTIPVESRKKLSGKLIPVYILMNLLKNLY